MPSLNITKNASVSTNTDQSLIFSAFAGNTQHDSTRDLTDEKVTFLWLQLLTDVLIHMPKLEREAHEEMIAMCRQQNQDNQEQLNFIEEFCNTYKRDDAIHWYTRQTCFFMLLNQALRTQDFDIIFKFRTLISDVYKQLKTLFKPLENSPCSYEVYRGQRLTVSELEKLRGKVGGLISMNSFVSTSRNRVVASMFAGELSSEPDIVHVIFEMKLDAKIAQEADTPFANIQCYSQIYEEEEVLLSMGTVFHIDSIQQESLDTSRVWNIKLTMCTIDNDEQVRIQNKNETKEVRYIWRYFCCI